MAAAGAARFHRGRQPSDRRQRDRRRSRAADSRSISRPPGRAVSMAQTFLDTPLLDKGTFYVNFFNGRLLSAEDLENERTAARRHQQQLGVGVGSAIIDGLHVVPLDQKEVRRLRITRGSAVNRQGQVLTLPEDVEIELRTEPA